MKALYNLVSSEVFEFTDNNMLEELHLERLTSSNGQMVIQRNPSLNMSRYCNRFDSIFDGNRMITENKLDCGEWMLQFC